MQFSVVGVEREAYDDQAAAESNHLLEVWGGAKQETLQIPT